MGEQLQSFFGFRLLLLSGFLLFAAVLLIHAARAEIALATNAAADALGQNARCGAERLVRGHKDVRLPVRAGLRGADDATILADRELEVFLRDLVARLAQDLGIDGQALVQRGQAPVLAEMVKAGELPPVDQRLPVEPAVRQPWDAIGKYGGAISVEGVDSGCVRAEHILEIIAPNFSTRLEIV